jgi:hypothetical protein
VFIARTASRRTEFRTRIVCSTMVSDFVFSRLKSIPRFKASFIITIMTNISIFVIVSIRLWDMMISVDDPAFTFFIGVALLR